MNQVGKIQFTQLGKSGLSLTLGALGIEPLQEAVSVWAANDVGVRLARLVKVVGVAAFAAEQCRVFCTPDGVAYRLPQG